MENKQTAVDWLVEQLARKHNEFQALTFYYDHKEEIEQAKQMEKQQKEEAYNQGTDNEFNGVGYRGFEKYHNETYGE